MRMRSPFLVAFAAALLAGCSSGPDFERPAKPTSTGYTPESLAPQTSAAGGPGGAAQSFVPAMDIPGEWWTLFHSPQLDTLIKEALQANPDIDAAQAALRQARENFYAQQGVAVPDAQRPTARASSSSPRWRRRARRVRRIMYGVTTASLNVSYSPDVFGGVRRQVESTEALAEVQRFQLEATYLSLTSNVVVAAINLASLQAQIDATAGHHPHPRATRSAWCAASSTWAAPRAPTCWPQEATLTQTRATLPPLQKQLAQQRNQLMRLVGRSPDQDRGESFDLAKLKLPQDLPLSLPSQLVEQRPDVRAAEAQLHSASADIGVAVANQMPQFTITGALGFSLGRPQLADRAGCRRLEHRARHRPDDPRWRAGSTTSARPRSRPTSARPRSTRAPCCRPSRTSPTRLRALQADADALRAQVEAEQTAAASLRLSEQQYQLGGVSYLILLNAQQTYQTAVINRLKAQAARYADTAALFQALGGGWWNRTDVDPKSMGKPGYFALPPVQDIKLPDGTLTRSI